MWMAIFYTVLSFQRSKLCRRACWLSPRKTTSILHHPRMLSFLTLSISFPLQVIGSELLEEDVGEESQHAGRQQPDHTLMDGYDVLQGVDALLHGVGVDVVIDGGADAPHRPHGIHHRLHGGGDHRECRLRPTCRLISCWSAALL